jgi:hypothetical protein
VAVPGQHADHVVAQQQRLAAQRGLLVGIEAVLTG